MEVQDLVFDDDLEIEDGDWKISDSDQQHIEHIIKANAGHFYQHPTLGVGIDNFKHAAVKKPLLKQRIKENLEADNYRVTDIVITGDVDSVKAQVLAKRLK